jgi:SsrA-binding protein
MAKNKKTTDPASNNERVVAQNRKARHEYSVLDSLECGIMLRGSEVKSLRGGTVSLAEAFGRIKGGELWLYNCDIPEYVEANRFNHEPRRPRKLLLHRREIERFAAGSKAKGFTLIPLKLYFKEGRAKVLMGICQGKRKHDKREAMKKAQTKKDLARFQMRRR